ncbi:MAG TPA: Tex-like N-terminal domain-containing protein, partial [Longimicrobiaceae bacterium]
MAASYAERIAGELALRPAQVRAALELLGEGNTIPFVARYRKEATGELDEVQLRDIRDRNEYLAELDARRATILASIEEQGKLDAELRARIERADSKSELEDLYRPYKPKRRTRATMAQERGLGPLAELIWEGRASDAEVRARAVEFVDADKGVATAEDALAGARDILAERIADDAGARSFVRDLTRGKGRLESRAAKGKEKETSKFQDYYDFSEPLKTIPGHRVLAIRRGEAEEFLTARILAPEEEIVAGLARRFAEKRAAREEMGLVV